MSITNTWREVLLRHFEDEVMKELKSHDLHVETPPVLKAELVTVFRQAQQNLTPQISTIYTRFLRTIKRESLRRRGVMDQITAYVLTDHFARQAAEMFYDLMITEGEEFSCDVNVTNTIFFEEGIAEDLFSKKTP